LTLPWIYLALAATVAGASFLPTLPRWRWLGSPGLYVALGVLAAWLLPAFPTLRPQDDPDQRYLVEVATQVMVIVSLAGAGLAIDTPPGWRRWHPTGRLLLWVMPVSVGLLAAVLGLIPGWTVPAALLLAAALAPTDPVLARSVQVEPPHTDSDGDEPPVRFSLTAEAGLNDGLAFPFIYLAIAALGGLTLAEAGHWLLVDVLWRVSAGTLVGVAVGAGLAKLVMHTGPELERQHTHEGVLLVSGVLAAYGLAELMHGYGFIAVFVAAVACREIDREHRYHLRTHRFAVQLESVLLAFMLLGFGLLLAGGVLEGLTWPGVAAGLLLTLVIRPAAVFSGFIGAGLPPRVAAGVGLLGIRGVGTVYYLAYAQNKADFGDLSGAWAVASFVILLSIVGHGITARPLLRWSEAGPGRRPGGLKSPDDDAGDDG